MPLKMPLYSVDVSGLRPLLHVGLDLPSETYLLDLKISATATDLTDFPTTHIV